MVAPILGLKFTRPAALDDGSSAPPGVEASGEDGSSAPPGGEDAVKGGEYAVDQGDGGDHGADAHASADSGAARRVALAAVRSSICSLLQRDVVFFSPLYRVCSSFIYILVQYYHCVKKAYM